MNENEELSKILRILQNYNANLSIQDIRGKNALLYLCSSKDLNIENLFTLCENENDLNIEDTKGRTPLLLLIKNSSLHLVKYLCSKGADVNHLNKFSSSPLLFSLFVQCNKINF